MKKMKLIHTSDWHLGHTLYGYDRTEEQLSMLSQMERLVVEHRPDALLVSGDLFHTTTPSAAVQQMFVEAMVRIHTAMPEMHIIVTAGNHDSASRHEVFRTPWRSLKVHVVGSVNRDNPKDCIIDIDGKGFVVAVPYINEHYLADDFFTSLLAIVDERNTDALPVCLMAHTTVAGSDFAGHDNATEFTAGGIDACELERFGESYDYLALGHIHKAQTLRGSNGKARYCGTPLPVSFDEGEKHSVTLVEINKHGDIPQITTIPIENPRPLVTLPAEGFTSWDEAVTLLQSYPTDSRAYLRVNVEVQDFLPAGANAEAVRLLADKQCRFCYINTRRRERQPTENVADSLTVAEFRQESPLSLVRRYAADKGLLFDDDLEALLKEIMTEGVDR